ncbi:unnamed protein product [Adineta steineri]|uniref:EGF-like domain-containing protein n=2 Tax=Adineta steineri TaxID=433720 RepID=A0A814TQU9_9BILA|nr:unnamed protein product [Adineta steineri]
MYYLDVSYNQPQFNECTTWNTTGISFQPNFTFSNPFGIFIDRNNSIYVGDQPLYYIFMWINNSIQLIKQIFINNISNANSIFVTSKSDIFVGTYDGVDKWILSSNNSTTVMYVNSLCVGLFVDINDTLYCSISSLNIVKKIWLGNNPLLSEIVAGTNSSGSNSTMLNSPRGIFVDVNFNLYVADYGNNRIQFFRSKQLNGITIAGNTSINTTITLSNPTDIVLDGGGCLFIVDSNNNRIVRSTLNGFQCIIGCDRSGSTSNPPLSPRRMTFDSYGNVYVTYPTNNSVQIFPLSTNSCETTTEISSTMNIHDNSSVISSMNVQHDTSTFLINQLTTSESSLSSPFFVMPFCGNDNIGLSCNISTTPCDIMQLCENNGTCINNNSIVDGYSCSCLQGFNGSNCQIDNRPCQSNTCWNNGTCNQTSDTTFKCLCRPEWMGIHCEIKIDYCQNVTCLNNGVCKPLLGDYKCECLSKSYSGKYCGIVSQTLVVHQTVSTSFDILKYCFGIDPTKDQLKRIQRRRRGRMKKIKPPPQIRKFIYIN